MQRLDYTRYIDKSSSPYIITLSNLMDSPLNLKFWFDYKMSSLKN